MTTQGGAARSFVDRIFETIRRCPDVVAVQDPQRALTYRQLDELSTALAASIQERVETFDPVVVDVPRSVDLVVAIFAVLRSGRGCVPVDRTQPARRTEAILANASARYEVRDVQPTGRRSRGQLDVVPLPPIDRPSADSRPPDVMEQLAYVLYTSGSTGEPKGVAMGCTPLSELMSWHAHTEGGSVPTRTAQFAPITFDVAWQEVLSSLVLGSTLLIIPDEVRRDPVRLLEHLSTTGVTRLFLPTAYLQTLADRGRRYAALPRLEHVFVAGSQLRITHEIRQWFAQLGGCRLHNHYGPTETHVVTSYTLGQDVSQWPDLPPIGRPLPHVSVRVVDADGADVPVGGTGELLLGGRCLANGYRNDSALTAERFVKAGGERWYRTGDLVEWRDDELWFLGRADRQVKIDGHRVEPAEVEVVLARHPDVSDAHVGVSVDGRGRPRLVAYVVSRTGMEEDLPVGRVAVPPWGDLIADVLPTYCVPSIWVRVDEIPLNAHGKVDLARLPDVKRDRPALAATYSPPRTRLERVIARVWEERLDVVGIGRDDNFFDLGGSSLLAAAMVGDVCAALGVELTLVEAYAHPTVRALAEHVDTRDTGVKANTRREHRRERTDAEQPIAVVGIACRFPGADSPAAYWSNLMSGTESITRRSAVRDEHGKTYAAGVLPDVDLFDAAYFGLSAAQARLLDPQHRLFLECCVEALEDAACVPRPETPIWLYAGSGPSTYMLNNLLSSRDARTLTGSVEDFNILMANDKEFLAGRASYALDLRGPSVNVNAACATSLYAVHYAAQALRFRDCDIALAGAAYIQVPQLFGYTYEESMPFSPDGHCRAFDRDAAGTVFGSGVGVVVLKPLAVALADGDDIYAVLRGTGISNDGAQKVGMTAPSVAGQERAIQMALEAGQVAPSSIRYVEAHGTATPVGDAIEIEALRRAYGPLPVASCGIGSVKNNVGHLGWASGMAGLIKAVLILRHQQVPPTPNYREPNPDLNLGSSPFVVDDRLRDLPTNGEPISVAVSAFGIGGFNAHAILEQAPEPVSQVEEPRRWYVLPFSARSDDACERLVDSFRDEPLAAVPVPDVARTLGTGRRHHERRRAAVAAADESLAAPLGRLGTQRPTTTYAAGQMVVGLFAGHGVERRGTGRELYETEPVFRSVLDSFDSLTKAELGATVASLLYAPERQDVPIRDVVEVHAITFAV
jgi:amino acid adenylation domain-containing protein